MAQGWEIRQVEKLFVTLLKNDATIKTRMGGTARVAVNRVPQDPAFFFYIFIYFIFGPDTRVQGGRRVMSNPDIDIEVRTIGAPTDDSEAVVARIDELMGLSRQLTPDSNWVVSAVPQKPISIVEQGEAPEVYYMRRGRSYSLQVVAA